MVLSKTKQQLLARQKAQEVLAKTKENTTVAVTNAKGTSRVAHTPTTVHITRPMVTHDPKRATTEMQTAKQKSLTRSSKDTTLHQFSRKGVVAGILVESSFRLRISDQRDRPA